MKTVDISGLSVEEAVEALRKVSEEGGDDEVRIRLWSPEDKSGREFRVMKNHINAEMEMLWESVVDIPYWSKHEDDVVEYAIYRLLKEIYEDTRWCENNKNTTIGEILRRNEEEGK